MNKFLSTCKEEGRDSTSSESAMEDEISEIENINKTVKQMAGEFEVFLKRQHLAKDDADSIQVHNVQVTCLQSMMEPHPLILHKWVHAFRYLIAEQKAVIDDIIRLMRKLHSNSSRQKFPAASTTKFRI